MDLPQNMQWLNNLGIFSTMVSHIFALEMAHRGPVEVPMEVQMMHTTRAP